MHVDLINVQLKRKENLNIDMAVTGGSPCSPQIFKNMKEILNVKKVKVYEHRIETNIILTLFEFLVCIWFIGNHSGSIPFCTKRQRMPINDNCGITQRSYGSKSN